MQLLLSGVQVICQGEFCGTHKIRLAGILNTTGRKEKTSVFQLNLFGKVI